MIDEYPILAVAGRLRAAGTTRMRGLGELRVKESDRLAATAALLAVNGVRVEIEGDDLIVHGAGAPSGRAAAWSRPTWTTASPCRSWCLGLAAEQPVTVDDAGFIDTSFPGFVELMNGLGARDLAPA